MAHGIHFPSHYLKIELSIRNGIERLTFGMCRRYEKFLLPTHRRRLGRRGLLQESNMKRSTTSQSPQPSPTP